MLKEKSPSPANSHYDFALRHERVRLLEKVLKQLDVFISRTVLAMREVASCLSLVGQSYHEVAQCVNSTNPHSTVNQAYRISAHNRLVEHYGVSLQNAATQLSAEMKSLRNGEEYSSYNSAMHQMVLMRLHEVLTNAQKTRDLGDEVKISLKRAMNSRKKVHQKEAKYMRKGLSLTQSKLYAKQAKKMRLHDEAAEAKRRAFDAEYESLMQRQLYVTGHTMGDFLDVNTVYMSNILSVLGCLAPKGAEVIQKMANSGERLGVAPEDQFGSQPGTQGLLLLGSSGATLVKGGAEAWPGREATFASNCDRSSHGFTGYHQEQCLKDPSAERAPPTARALERGDESNECCCAFSGTPQRQLISGQMPVSAATGTTGVSKATSCAFSADEPHASPPLRTPSFPAAVRRVDATVMQHPNQHTFGGPALSGAPGVATYAGKQAEPLKSAAPATVVVMTGDRRGDVREATTARNTCQASSCHAPFGDGSSPAVEQPAARSSLATPPAAYNEERRMGQSWGRSAALAAPMTMHGFDCARSAEPFEDTVPISTHERTPHASLPPMELFPLETDEDCGPREATPRVSTATTVAAEAVTQKHLHRDKSSVMEAAAAAKGGAPRLSTASAPPDEDMVGSGVNTQRREIPKKSTPGRCIAQGQRPRPQPQSRLPQCPQRHAAPQSLTNFQAMTLEGGLGASLCQCCSDSLGSEAGGVSGCSHNLSTSYELNSPVPTPQRRVLDTHAWEDAQVRPCSPVLRA
ncbi:hypothetical protein LSCM1_06109 [Leishmania martiniquensis]|uniref:Uncharacterized protein n=1 Tax=Leishmania martiniquensis TaxID=1580590 RepID=A0A836HKX4_9TRYP|nr:hypothetical protein LSCM1_06109 [Leishmania martiniquensis]